MRWLTDDSQRECYIGMFNSLPKNNNTELYSLKTTDSIAPKLGRPKSDSKHAAIMSAAACLFMSIGYERTSMDAIASRAGVSKQTVYSHFSSKEELFRQCIIDKMRTYELEVAQTDANQPLRATLINIGHRYLNLLFDEQVVAVHRLLIAETPTFPRLATMFWETGPEELLNGIATFLRNNTGAGHSNIVDPDQAAEDFTCLIESRFVKRLLMNHMQPLSDHEKQRHVDRCVDQLLRLHDAPLSEH